MEEIATKPASSRGSTTLVVQLVDLATGEVEGVRTALNPQARYGADIMTRIQFDLARPGVLRNLIRRSVGSMLGGLSAGRALREVQRLIPGDPVAQRILYRLDRGDTARVEPTR